MIEASVTGALDYSKLNMSDVLDRRRERLVLGFLERRRLAQVAGMALGSAAPESIKILKDVIIHNLLPWQTPRVQKVADQDLTQMSPEDIKRVYEQQGQFYK